MASGFRIHVLNQVKEFKYLRVLFTSEVRVEQETGRLLWTGLLW